MLVSKGLEILREDGIVTFTNKLLNFLKNRFHSVIRPVLPVSGFRTYNSVKVEQAKLCDEKFQSLNDENREGGLVTAHKRFTKSGDLVHIVGGGVRSHSSESCQDDRRYWRGEHLRGRIESDQ